MKDKKISKKIRLPKGMTREQLSKIRRSYVGDRRLAADFPTNRCRVCGRIRPCPHSPQMEGGW